MGEAVNRLSRFGLTIVAIFALTGCDAFTGQRVCTLVGFPPPINVAVRDGSGRPQALGAVATFQDGSATVGDSTRTDSLVISGGNYNGTYDIFVSKPWYNTTVVRGVHAPQGDQCAGHHDRPITVPAVLALAFVSPPIRSVFLVPSGGTLDRGRNATLGLFVDASPGVSRAVHWRVVGDTSSVSLDSTTNTLLYRCQVHTGYVTVTAKSIADSTLADSANFAVQGHPGSPSDPPCP